MDGWTDGWKYVMILTLFIFCFRHLSHVGFDPVTGNFDVSSHLETMYSLPSYCLCVCRREQGVLIL